MAVERSLGWAAVKMSDQMTGKCKIVERASSEVSGVSLYKYVRAFVNKIICTFMSMCARARV